MSSYGLCSAGRWWRARTSTGMCSFWITPSVHRSPLDLQWPNLSPVRMISRIVLKQALTAVVGIAVSGPGLFQAQCAVTDFNRDWRFSKGEQPETVRELSFEASPRQTDKLPEAPSSGLWTSPESRKTAITSTEVIGVRTSKRSTFYRIGTGRTGLARTCRCLSIPTATLENCS